MDRQEIEKLQLDTQALSAADEKRKRFEENLQREKEQKERKREIMMRKEKEYEQVSSRGKNQNANTSRTESTEYKICITQNCIDTKKLIFVWFTVN